MAYAKGDPRQKEAVRRYYLKNKPYYLAANKLKKSRIREWLNQLKSRPCMDCRQSYPAYVMDFDHRPNEQKLCEPNRLPARMNWSLARTEIAKCDVVCSNCHRTRTQSRGGYGVAKEHSEHHLSH